MASYSNFTLTNRGMELFSDLLRGQGEMEFRHLAAGAGIYGETERGTEHIRGMEALKEERQRIPFSAVKKGEGGTVGLKADLSNQGLAEGYYITEIGIYAGKKGEAEEVLYCVATTDNPDYMPDSSSGRNYNVIFRTLISLGDAEEITVNYTSDSYVSAEDFREALDSLKEETDRALEKKADSGDLREIAEALKDKADAVAGKGLSKNDYTDEDKTAVAGLSGLSFGKDADGNWGYKAPGTTEVAPFGASGGGAVSGLYYCTCGTAGDDAAKTADCEGFELRPGAAAFVRFANTNTARNITLDVGGTGPKYIGWRGMNSYFDGPLRGDGFFQSGRTYLFFYNGVSWQCASLPGDEVLYANRYIYKNSSIKCVSESMSGRTEGDMSVSFGGFASGDHSAAFCAGGASARYAFASGNGTASGIGAHASARGTASGDFSSAEGWSTASGQYSHAGGMDAQAEADYSYADGWKTAASGKFCHAVGHYNVRMDDSASHVNTSGTAFCIGNGTDDSARSNAFSVMFDGSVNAAGAVSGAAADYAEYFEWLDGNPGFEDRAGLFVTMEGEKIRPAGPEDGYILGIVSGAPFVLGNGDGEAWKGMYLRDGFGRILYERAPLAEAVEAPGADGVPRLEERPVLDADGRQLYMGARPVLNPAYNPEEPYVRRSDRPEWDAVGMLGVLAVRQDGTCRTDGYCTCGEGGKASACGRKAENCWRVIQVVSESIIKVVFR